MNGDALPREAALKFLAAWQRHRTSLEEGLADSQAQLIQIEEALEALEVLESRLTEQRKALSPLGLWKRWLSKRRGSHE
jgi:predicted nuclease with TOPRIM domain